MSNINAQRILVVDDDPDILLSAQIILKHEFDDVLCIENPAALEETLPDFEPDVVLLDMNFTRGLVGGDEGLYWLGKIKAYDPNIQVVMSTAYGEVELAVTAIKQGAADFVQKPWLNEKLIATLKACAKITASTREIDLLKGSHQAFTPAKADTGSGELIGQSPAFQSVLDLISRVAPSDANVLVTGENGTGKELIARAIHQHSQRARGPLVSVDVGALPNSLFESEMFGHTKGAFTDAKSERPGKFEQASGGTLFLDEIGNLELDMQAKLLRALESRNITRVGGTRTIPIDIRLVSATNVTREQLADTSYFRADLLYRINTVEINVPPLRERKEDIPLLLAHYQTMFGKKYGRDDIYLTPDTLEALITYPWPGNVRELKHATERAIIVSDSDELKLENFLSEVSKDTNRREEFNLEILEQQAIRDAVSAFGGNMTKVAKALGLGRTTLYRKMEKYGIENE